MSRETVGRPMEILLVEDDLEDAGLTIEALKQSQIRCRITLVVNGEEATEFLGRQGRFARVPQPDLILLDLGLPRKDGRQVLAEIRADPRLQRIPVVVLTASESHREILQGEGLRVESFLTKPVDTAHFIAVVQSLRRYWLADVVLPD